MQGAGYAAAAPMPPQQSAGGPGAPLSIAAIMAESPTVLRRVTPDRIREEAMRVSDAERMLRWRRWRSRERGWDFHPVMQFLGCIAALALTAGCVTMLLLGYDAAMAEVARRRIKQAPPPYIDPQLQAQLGDEIRLSGFAMRVPKEMVERSTRLLRVPPNCEARLFARRDPPQSMLLMTVRRLPRRLKSNELQSILAEELRAANASGVPINLQSREGERLINQIVAIRGTMAMGTASGALNGMYLLGHDGRYLVMVIGLTSEAPGTQEYRLLNAALSTVRRS
jgi:hypothetical protein